MKLSNQCRVVRLAEVIHGNDDDQVRQLVARFDKEYPRAGAVVDGRKVRNEIPNLDSISASLSNYKVLPDVREFPIEGFGGARSYYAADDQRQVRELAERIKRSKEINPVIIVEEKQGPYILEGGHRVSALVELGAVSVPALIILDLEELLP